MLLWLEASNLSANNLASALAPRGQFDEGSWDTWHSMTGSDENSRASRLLRFVSGVPRCTAFIPPKLQLWFFFCLPLWGFACLGSFMTSQQKYFVFVWWLHNLHTPTHEKIVKNDSSIIIQNSHQRRLDMLLIRKEKEKEKRKRKLKIWQIQISVSLTLKLDNKVSK